MKDTRRDTRNTVFASVIERLMKMMLMFFLFIAFSNAFGIKNVKASADDDLYLEFTSSSEFSIEVTNPYWNGKLYYSTDKTTWNKWGGEKIEAEADSSIYFRGQGNTRITYYYNYPWSITGENISCNGNIENLLDYETVAAGKHPPMWNSCYESMFEGCTGLIKAPSLPATTLAENCYDSMFKGCANLITAPELPATKLVYSCYNSMFYGCTSLKETPELPATVLAEQCYFDMFGSCISLKKVPELPATTLAEWCYVSMFQYCTNLIETPNVLPATTLAENCYDSMFKGCTSLTTAPSLPATTLADNCYCGMFYDCPSLEKAPELPATTLTDSCYKMMFYSCYSLTETPELPATVLAKWCYAYMFYCCDGLTETPELPAATLADSCYHSMFYHCHGLKVAPELPATTLAEYCYCSMFEGCYNLKSTPNLPATDLADYCYNSMFKGCSGLTALPELSATILANECYAYMFQGCTGIVVSETESGRCVVEYRIPNEGIGVDNNDSATKGMFEKTRGPFKGTPEINKVYYVPGTLAEMPAYKSYIEFTSSSEFSIEVERREWEGLIYYSTDKETETEWKGEKITVSAGSSVYFRGRNNTKITNNGFPWIITGENVSCNGNIEALLDYKTVEHNEHPQMASFCYIGMFENCTNLIKAPELSATTLANGCYENMFKGCTSLMEAPELSATTLAWQCYWCMFEGCTSLTKAPDILPATTLVSHGYYCMFKDCTNLTIPPELPATTLAQSCYGNMFDGCISLTKTPELPATTLALDCYGNMFKGCTSLITAPELPTTLADYCYNGMFNGCTSLATAPELSANTLTYGCYASMFDGCTSLTAAPELPATTLTGDCYAGMFSDCVNLIEAPELPAVTLTYRCYEDMFEGCTSLTKTPELPATTLAEECYRHMFQDCTSLTEVPKLLPATALDNYCYEGMFKGCTSLKNSPELPATTLAWDCYEEMFRGCTNLVTVPKLPATTMDSGCYAYMFRDCINLTKAPVLSANILADYCYDSMFRGCTGLTTAPELPATTLAEYCYCRMFQDCTGLIEPPELPAVALVYECYVKMFEGCTYIRISTEKTEKFSKEYRIPKEGVGVSEIGDIEVYYGDEDYGDYIENVDIAMYDMFADIGGPFTGTPEINKVYYVNNKCPEPLQNFEFDTKYNEVQVGNQISVTAKAVPEDAVYRNVVWESEDPEVAEIISCDGLTAVIKVYKMGSVRITISAGNIQNYCIVRGIRLYGFDSDGSVIGSSDGYTVRRINKSYYCFDEKGCVVAGPVMVSGKSYYFDHITGKALIGLQEIKGDTYFFNKDGTMAVNSMVKVKGTTYHFGEDGRAEGGIYYLPDKSGSAWFAFDDEGIMQSGVFAADLSDTSCDASSVSADAKLYCFKNGKLYIPKKNGFFTLNGYRYYVYTDGHVATDETEFADGKGNGIYQINPKTGRLYVGAVPVDGELVPADKNGQAVTPKKPGLTKVGCDFFWYNDDNVYTGWKDVPDNKGGIKGTYYFDPDTGASSSGIRKIDGVTYVFVKGACVRNDSIVTVNKKKYAVKVDGTDGRAVVQTGWVNINGKLYFAKDNGVVRTGLFTLSGNTLSENTTHFANTAGVVQTDKWVTMNKVKYYADTTGSFATGRQSIKGKTYYLDPGSSPAGAMMKGLITEPDGNTYLYANNGVLQTGNKFVTFNKRKYFVDQNGKVCGIEEGHIQAPGPKGASVTYELDADGSLLNGTKDMGGKLYLYKNGLQVLSSARPAKGGDGVWKTVNGRKYLLYYTDDTLSANTARTGRYTDAKGVSYMLRENGDLASNSLAEVLPDEVTEGMTPGEDGRFYFFYDKKGRLIKTPGWYKVGKNFVYIYESGTAASGWATISGKTYWFDPDSGLTKMGVDTVS